MAEGSKAFEHAFISFSRCGLTCPDHPVGKCVFCEALDVWRATEARVECAEPELAKWHLKAGQRGEENTKLRAALREVVEHCHRWVEHGKIELAGLEARGRATAGAVICTTLSHRHEIDPATLEEG